jgi:hypothetical protein
MPARYIIRYIFRYICLSMLWVEKAQQQGVDNCYIMRSAPNGLHWIVVNNFG